MMPSYYQHAVIAGLEHFYPFLLAGLLGFVLYRLILKPTFPAILRALGWRKPGQRRRARAARRVLAKLESIDHEAARLAYLRNIDPFVFEELILEAFERRGLRVKRNQRYTGDGGIDGCVWTADGQLHLIQAKRYASHINPQHVRDFSALLTQRNCKGFFVHTGKTGRLSNKLANADPRMTVISGSRLLRLLVPETTPATTTMKASEVTQ